MISSLIIIAKDNYWFIITCYSCINFNFFYLVLTIGVRAMFCLWIFGRLHDSVVTEFLWMSFLMMDSDNCKLFRRIFVVLSAKGDWVVVRQYLRQVAVLLIKNVNSFPKCSTRPLIIYELLGRRHYLINTSAQVSVLPVSWNHRSLIRICGYNQKLNLHDQHSPSFLKISTHEFAHFFKNTPTSLPSVILSELQHRINTTDFYIFSKVYRLPLQELVVARETSKNLLSTVFAGLQTYCP